MKASVRCEYLVIQRGSEFLDSESILSGVLLGKESSRIYNFLLKRIRPIQEIRLLFQGNITCASCNGTEAS